MLFQTPLFFFFFLVFYFLHSFVVSNLNARKWLTLVASAIFYGAWNWKFIPLMAGNILLDYFVAQEIHKNKSKKVRKKWMLISLVGNLGTLAIFKYLNFFLSTAGEFCQFLGIRWLVPHLDIVLPVGISFYTFQSMSYTIDVYRRQLKPSDDLVAFAASVSFFPQLVAGPILRASQILPQIVRDKVENPKWCLGLLLFGIGLIKKGVADGVLAPIADTAFIATSQSAGAAWAGMLAFTGQIYADFSGYSDMAIGIGMILGYDLALNFKLPYLSSSPNEFWRRWHISLSFWMRDYIYMSLGGGRKAIRNVFITMTLGGLWHGANWPSILWGVYHGFILIFTVGLGRIKLLQRLIHIKCIKPIRILVTFYLICVGETLFRSNSVSAFMGLMRDSHGFGGENLAIKEFGFQTNFGLAVFGLVFCHFIDAMYFKSGNWISKSKIVFWIFIVVVYALGFSLGTGGQRFIYFDF